MRPFMSARIKQYDTYIFNIQLEYFITSHEDKQAFAIIITLDKPEDHSKYVTLKMSYQLQIINWNFVFKSIL